MDEFNAIQQLKRNNLKGLEWLVDRYHVQAVQTAFLITGDAELAEDVTQEVFLNLFDTIMSFDERRPFRPWFLRCVSNLAVKKSQKQARQISLDSGSSDYDWIDRLVSAEEAVEEQVIQSELKEKLWHGILQLSPRQRAAVVQRYFLEMGEKEMAETLQSAPGTVKWILFEARRVLRAILKAEGDQL